MIETSELPPLLEVILNHSFASKRDVIDAIGQVLVASSAVTPAYVEGMRRKEELGSTVIGSEVALPHGTRDVKDAVLRNALVIVPIPDGVEWTPGQFVRLAIGFAGVGDESHLRLLAAIARGLSDEKMVAQLKTATQADAVVGLVDRLLSAPAS